MSQKTAKKYVVLLSSGLDSTINTYIAHQKGEVVLALTFDYGQRAATEEILNAQKTCRHLNIPHQVVNLDFFKSFTQTSLINTNEVVPTNMAIDNKEECDETAKAVWVPNRNGIFINIAAGFAEGLRADEVVVGFNIEEGTTFPDNTQEYLNEVNGSFEYSTMQKIKVGSFTTALNKTEIVKLGRDLKVDFKNVWSCYFAGEKPCGQCESCLRLTRALGT